MVQLNLNDEEQQVLADILDDVLSDLRMEISATDRMTYREAIKQHEEILKGILKSIRPENQPTPAS